MADSQSSYHKPDLRWDTITPTIITTVLATAVVILRLIVRCKFVKAVGFDDFVIVVSLFLSWVVLGLTVVMVVTGFGSYAWHSPLDLHSATAKLFLSWNVLYVVLIHVTKASILTQYLRIFPTRTMRRLTWLLFAALVPSLLWVEPPGHDIEKAEVDQTDGTRSRSVSSADRLEKITEELEDSDELTLVGTREGMMNTETRNHRTKSWSEQTILDMEGVIARPEVAVTVTSPLTAYMREEDRKLREEQSSSSDKTTILERNHTHTAPPTMLLPRIRTLPTGSSPSLATVETALSALRLSPVVTNTSITVRHASHKAQGAANSAKDGAGKRLGAKKSGEQYVIPGNIIFRQRGTKWFPGDNVGMGRDHTIYATQPGYVKYYKDPLKHPKRQYIGVVFERNQVLPQPPHAVRRRRLGMLAHQMETSSTSVGFTGDLMSGTDAALPGSADMAASSSTIREAPKEQRAKVVVKDKRTGELVRATPTLRPGYQYRAANWEIGRAAERAGVKVTPFKPGNRFLAWRKSNVRKAKNAERRGLTRRR
ncbi:ribosomal protein L27 [Aureobasidium subglaciale]|nr:ribosomal protein L27 [Aureobasidium subglaciale]